MKNLHNKINNAIDDISLSANEKNQLAQARQQALSEPKKSFFSSFSSPIMAYASLFLVVGIVTISLLNKPTDFTKTSPQFDETFALISSQEPVELYEDLEFYMWLEVERVKS